MHALLRNMPRMKTCENRLAIIQEHRTLTMVTTALTAAEPMALAMTAMPPAAAQQAGDARHCAWWASRAGQTENARLPRAVKARNGELGRHHGCACPLITAMYPNSHPP